MTPRDGRLGIGAASEESLPVGGGDLDAPPDATNEAGEAQKARRRYDIAVIERERGADIARRVRPADAA